jgi:hypothetical protein
MDLEQDYLGIVLLYNPEDWKISLSMSKCIGLSIEEFESGIKDNDDSS